MGRTDKVWERLVNIKLFRRKLKQCTNCGQTFYKTNKTNDHFDMTYEISPCCNDDYEIVANKKE